ncbi:ABC-2 type transport system ATP-binding protein [Catenulispora sp. GAS73]|uniref:ATP-binding cassette domain-containing protein n=1 Tax=Catenulispora sp. GAS73 TaxID=3156269 RepID=UPI003514FAD3
MTTPPSYAVQVEDLRKSYDEDTEVLRGLSLQVEPGEIYGFLGPNGAGKSTCLRILCALLKPTSGRALVAGHDVVARPFEVRARIGASLQNSSLDPLLTPVEFLTLQARLYGLSKAEAARRVAEVEDILDLGEAAGRRIGTYSGGMMRRVDIAAALIARPEVVFLDEPTTGLDPDSRTRVWRKVRELNREHGITFFLTTQYLEEADQLAQRVGILNEGRLAAEDTPSALKSSLGTDLIIVRTHGPAEDAGPGSAPEALRRLAGVTGVAAAGDRITVQVESGAEWIGPVAVALAQHGTAVADIALRTPTLDDVFFRVTGSRFEQEALTS